MTDTNNNRDKAREIFWRFEEVVQRGHEDYMVHARRLEDFYLGGGRQWEDADRVQREGEGRPCREVNTILPIVNAAAGYQIANRVDISYLPKGGMADSATAKVLGKVVKHSLDNTRYRWSETEAFLDGMIQQRGYLDVRMDYSENLEGEVRIFTPDPMDVVPDPDAKGYDPDTWGDVHLTRWLTADDIEGLYGKEAADHVVANAGSYTEETNWGAERVDRDGFGNLPYGYAKSRGWYGDNPRLRRYRLIDKQANVYETSLVAVFPGGDLHVAEHLSPEHMSFLSQQGVSFIQRRMRRVRWQVACPEAVFYDQLSPYDHITLVPYFPYFRRGRTIGMVDNMVSPAEMLNKFVSQYEHVVNTSANSGWQGEADSLANMSDDEFTNEGATTGLMLLRKSGKPEFKKIEPNQVPNGINLMIDMAANHLNVVSGVDPNGMGIDVTDMSGVALQSLEYAQQKKLAVALDNLERTRYMVADRVLEMVQKFMGSARVIRITEVDPYGVEYQVPLAINQQQPDGRILRDLTVGDYDAAVHERPANVTFNNSEFEQLKAMVKEMGIAIPPAVVVRASNLADKEEIAQALREAQGEPDPRIEAEAALKRANANLAEAKAVGERLKALFAAIQTGQAIVMTPGSAPLADSLARSAGFQDQDAPPIVPNAPVLAGPAQSAAAPGDTTPLTPASPMEGANAGMTDDPLNPPQ